jgi:hypothetical protein
MHVHTAFRTCSDSPAAAAVPQASIACRAESSLGYAPNAVIKVVSLHLGALGSPGRAEDVRVGLVAGALSPRPSDQSLLTSRTLRSDTPESLETR